MSSGFGRWPERPLVTAAVARPLLLPSQSPLPLPWLLSRLLPWMPRLPLPPAGRERPFRPLLSLQRLLLLLLLLPPPPFPLPPLIPPRLLLVLQVLLLPAGCRFCADASASSRPSWNSKPK